MELMERVSMEEEEDAKKKMTTEEVVVEIRAVQLMKHLLKENFFSSCRKFCLSILPYVPAGTRERLETLFLAKIEALGSEKASTASHECIGPQARR